MHTKVLKSIVPIHNSITESFTHQIKEVTNMIKRCVNCKHFRRIGVGVNEGQETYLCG